MEIIEDIVTFSPTTIDAEYHGYQSFFRLAPFNPFPSIEQPELRHSWDRGYHLARRDSMAIDGESFARMF